ncbi:hypothetical protein Bca101_075342 [Brassica carinata]
MFPSSLMGCHPRPGRPFTVPFSYPIPSSGDVPEADSEAVPMAPLRRRHSCFFNDGPLSEIREGDLANIRRKYVAIYEAYLEAGFRGVIPSLIGEVSSVFGFNPSQLTPLTLRTLMAIQVLGELHEFSVGVYEILYSDYFAPLVTKAGFYHFRSRDGTPLVEEPSRGIRGNYPFGDDWKSRYVFVKIQEPFGYPSSWGTIDVSRPVSFAGEAVAKLIMGVPRRYRWVTFLVSREPLRHSRVWGNVVRLPISAVYDEYQRAKVRRRRPSFAPPPRLTRAALSANGLSSTSSTGAEAVPHSDPLVATHRRLIGEVFLLRVQVQDMVAHRDLLVQQVRALG